MVCRRGLGGVCEHFGWFVLPHQRKAGFEGIGGGACYALKPWGEHWHCVEVGVRVCSDIVVYQVAHLNRGGDLIVHFVCVQLLVGL